MKPLLRRQVDTRRAVRPTARDVLSSIVELLLWGLSSLLSVGSEEARLKGAFLSAVVLVGLIAPLAARRPEALVAWLVVGVVLWIHARDIAHARARLKATVEAPGLAVEAASRTAGLSPQVAQIDLCRDAFIAAFNKDFSLALRIASRVERQSLDTYARCVLDATTALVLFSMSQPTRGTSCALVSIPIGNNEVDLSLGINVLRHSWHAADRLEAIEKKWGELGAPLDQLAPLARMRRRLLRGDSTLQIEMDVQAEQLAFLREVAEKLGDISILEVLQAKAHRANPYR